MGTPSQGNQGVQTSVVVSEVKNTLSSYLKLHETLIIIIILSVVVYFSWSKGVSYLAEHDQIVSNKATVLLQAQVESTKKSADTTQQTLQQYQAIVAQLLAQKQQINAAQVQRAQDTQKQQTVDQTLPPSSFAGRWSDLVKTTPDNIVPAANGYMVSTPAAVNTLVLLETIPQLQADLQGQETIVADDTKQINSLNVVVNAQTVQIDSLNTQIVDQIKANVAQIKAIKAEARKGKLKWFLIGYVAGFVSREIIKP